MFKKYELAFTVGYTMTADEQPKEIFPAKVPGAVQLDYAAYKGWKPFYMGTHYRDYAWMEDVYWHYHTSLSFTLDQGQTAQVLLKGIDYQYKILIDSELLFEGEGMFSPVYLDVTGFAGKEADLEVLICPSPKADDSGTRSQAAKSCKAAACYGWDWHPRLLTAGLWDEAVLMIQDSYAIHQADVSYRLNDKLDCCRITTDLVLEKRCDVRLALKLDNDLIMEKDFPSDGLMEKDGFRKSYELMLHHPELWQPTGYGSQPVYTLVISTLTPDGAVSEQMKRKIGFCRSRLVMNEGSWDFPDAFPKSRSDAPATLEINGQRIFAKGSNWVNAQVFPGEMSREHYEKLLRLVKDANMNILRVWGGGFINKESFYDLCDELGIMVWQEFPLACNEYPDDEAYLAVLEKEATAIVRRLRTHPCLVLWCGGNELFNNWSRMTDQHHALRLLNSICYREDQDTPFMMTSPLNGMAHGHYLNYDEETGQEFITLLTHSHYTAYTEFGCPAVADETQLMSFMSDEEYADFRPDHEVWIAHHGFHAWRENCWVRLPEVEYFYGGYEDQEDLFRKTQQIQCISYRSCFEEMRKQWPHCSMALNWCLNEPWPTIGNNCLILWPDKVRPAYDAVKSALRETLASLRVERHLFYSGETFQAEVWMLHDALQPYPEGEIRVSYSFGEMPEEYWGTLHFGMVQAQTNYRCGGVVLELPREFEGEIHIRLQVENHPEADSDYVYLCRRKSVANTKGMLNV